jgi:acyl-CoA synthetase (AMP-forming)/AMP-acid ligase II
MVVPDAHKKMAWDAAFPQQTRLLWRLMAHGGYGLPVYPSDVETVLARHPAVADCVVFGLPDDHWGEAVHAAVETKRGAGIDVDEVIGFIKHELGSVKTPKFLHVYESLPKSAVGKVLKNKVRDEVVAGMISRASR